jgi:hypothetical protein
MILFLRGGGARDRGGGVRDKWWPATGETSGEPENGRVAFQIQKRLSANSLERLSGARPFLRSYNMDLSSELIRARKSGTPKRRTD